MARDMDRIWVIPEEDMLAPGDLSRMSIKAMAQRSGAPVRPDWDDYFLMIALAVANRAECSRRQVGAVLVKDHRIRSTGYNGAPQGAPSCLTGACPRATSGVTPGSGYDSGPGTCIAIHAEANALLFASKDDCEGATLYITHNPCAGCERLILGSGVTEVVTLEGRFTCQEGRLLAL
jgi:dCMP deaminase